MSFNDTYKPLAIPYVRNFRTINALVVHFWMYFMCNWHPPIVIIFNSIQCIFTSFIHIKMKYINSIQDSEKISNMYYKGIMNKWTSNKNSKGGKWLLSYLILNVWFRELPISQPWHVVISVSSRMQHDFVKYQSAQ